jgi:hypothetical protein
MNHWYTVRLVYPSGRVHDFGMKIPVGFGPPMKAMAITLRQAGCVVQIQRVKLKPRGERWLNWMCNHSVTVGMIAGTTIGFTTSMLLRALL